MTHSTFARTELRGGIEASLQSFSTSIGPILLYLALFGAVGLAAGVWATLVTATLVHGVSLLIRGNAALMPCARVASLATYAGLVLHLSTNAVPGSAGVSLAQLRVGLAAGALMFALASVLVLLFGAFRLGNVFKMIPTPVTAGISNGTALLLVSLAVQQASQVRWSGPLTAVAMTAAYVLWPRVQARWRSVAWLPGIVLAIALGVGLVGLFHAFTPMAAPGPALAVANAAPALAWTSEWLSVQLWPQWLSTARVDDVRRLLMIGLPGALTLALVMILETFTAAGVMETRFGVRCDANRELLVLGGSNLVAALAGGVPSTGSSIRSVASWQAGGRSWQASAISLVLTALLLVVLGAWLMAMPPGIMGGLLLIQAILLADPVFMRKLWARVNRRTSGKVAASAGASPNGHGHDGEGTKDLGFWITLAITLVGFLGNLIWACFLGIGLSCLAVLRRLSGSLTAHWVYLDHYRSRRVRNVAETFNLQREFHQVAVLRLTGHVFFGNSVRITQLADELHADVIAVVLDVGQVHEVDTSGLDALQLLTRLLLERQLHVVVTGLRRTRSHELRQMLAGAAGVAFQPDLDRGLEACEDRVLAALCEQHPTEVVHLLAGNGLLQDLSAEETTEVMLLGEQRDVPSGSALFYKDARADGIWLIESGVVSILAGQGDDATRLATFGPGQFVGEMGFVDGKTRSATAWAVTPVRALLIDAAAIAALIERQPGAALKITRNIARELSHRVRSTSAMLADDALDASADWANSSLLRASRF